MSQIKQSKLDGTPIPGLFEKVRTEADEYRFVSAEAGHSQIIHRDDSSRVAAYLTATPPYYEFSLDFKYLVGKKQLRVGIMNPATGSISELISLSDIQAARTDPNWPPVPSPDINVSVVQHFSEASDDTVRVYNMGTNKLVWFSVPHTSLQGSSRSKITVEDQGDGVAEEFLGEGNGLLLTSRDGTKGLLTIDDELNLRVDPR
jgi:hypothetical protein